DTADLEVLAGVRVLLESLPAHRWAIVTSATRRLLLGRLKAAGLPVPDRIISGDQVKHGKPDPEPYRRGAELLGVKPQDCLVFEDAPSGVRAGVAAGCKVLGVLGTHSAEELREAGANWIVSSLTKVRAEGSRWANHDCDRSDLGASPRQQFRHQVQVLFCVDADGVVRTFAYVDVDVVFEQAQLLEALDLLKLSGRQCSEASQSLLAVGIEAEVLPVGHLLTVTVEGNCGAREVECAAVW